MSCMQIGLFEERGPVVLQNLRQLSQYHDLKEASLLDIYVWDMRFDPASFKGHIFDNFVPKSVLLIGYNS